MVDDDDDFTYHVNRQPADKINRAQINMSVHSLITKERMQKLDLLVHLLSNLTQALVVCGPEGIGKTTLLDVLQECKTESLRYYFIQGNADLSFETIHGQLALDMSQGKSLSMTLRQYEDQHKQVVLLVDNAGELVPGLITAIIQYAAANPALRVVFALTHDELQMKRGSDRAVDDCHVVEIPPLSERQCGDFLQDLSTKPYVNLSFKVISESMIAHIYRSTHGVPGRIIAEISGLSVAKPSGKLKWILALAVVAAIAIAIGVQWLMSSTTVPGIVLSTESSMVMQSSLKDNDKELIASAPVEQKADNIEPQPEAIQTLPPDQSVVQPVIAPSVAEVPTNEAIEVNAHKDDQRPAALVAKPELANAIVSKSSEKLDVKVQPEPMSAVGVMQKLDNKQSALVQQKLVSPSGTSQEKPKQPELTKAVNNVETPIAEKPAHKPNPANEVVVEPKLNSKQSNFVPQKIAEPLVASQEKPKQPVVAQQKTVESLSPEKMVVKVQPVPMSTAVDQKQDDNKPSVGVQQSMTERLWVKQEELKKAELGKTINSIETLTPNNQEITQTPQKSIEIAATPKEPVIEAAVPTPPQLEPSRIDSLPIATLPTPRDGGSAANGLEPLPPPSLAVGRTGSLPVAALPPSLAVGRTGSLPVAALPPSLAVEASSVQSDNNFTLQLMVLSKQSSADDLRKKYPAMEPDIRVIKTIVKGKEKFTLEYGSYSDAASANKARQSLPFEFHNALVRKIVR